jgi:hypothetical protein
VDAMAGMERWPISKLYSGWFELSGLETYWFNYCLVNLVDYIKGKREDGEREHGMSCDFRIRSTGFQNIYM